MTLRGFGKPATFEVWKSYSTVLIPERTAMFGEFVKKYRMSKRLTLRQFCSALEFDPSHWSKIERGILAPPKNDKVLRHIAQVLGMAEGSAEYVELFDLAALGTGRIPSDILSDADLAKYLPLVFRTVRNSKPTETDLRALAELIRDNVSQTHLKFRESTD